MKIINNWFIINIFAILTNSVFSYGGQLKNKQEDKFYMIFVNNTYGEIASYQGLKKRQESEIFVNTMIDEIHNLIIDNKDTYQNVSKLEEMESNALKRKRDNQVEPMDYGNSPLVYPISSLKSRTVLYAFLSPTLAKDIEKKPGIISCVSDFKLKYAENTIPPHFNLTDIQRETKWDAVGYRDGADLHLSLISQGKYEESLIGKYDRTYYYPTTAGEDVDLVIFDSGFNFNHKEFSNTKERTAKCVIRILEGRVQYTSSEKDCGSHVDEFEYHGEKMSDIAAGLDHGVAPKANVYGVVPESIDMNDGADVIAGLQYAIKHLIRPHRTVFNFSFQEMYNYEEENELLSYWQDLINEVTELGGIIVAAAGNDNSAVIIEETKEISYPCAFENVICVGAINNFGKFTYQGEKRDVMATAYYQKAPFSNYGKGVDIFAPGYAYAYYSIGSEDFMGYSSGTSVASPIVAGVIATIISENSDIEFTTSTMLEYLIKTGHKNIIRGISEGDNIFISNGKRTVYSENNDYYGCGINSGNQQCDDNQCCAENGNCYSSADKVCTTDNGCQKDYGTCVLVISPEENRCGKGYGSCVSGCCSYDGYCGYTSEYCEVGCQNNYGFCI